MPDGRGDAVVVFGALFGTRYPHLVAGAVARGLTVLGVDARSPGKELVDRARRTDAGHPLAGLDQLAWIDAERPEQLLEQVIEWGRQHRVRAVIALGEDFVEPAATVADYLGVPSPGLRAARVCRNKLLQRRMLSEVSPLSRLLSAEERAGGDPGWDTFPAVVKPVARQASSGVIRVAGPAELRAALSEYEPGEPVLVEQLVEGHEISVEALVQHGEVIFSSPTGKRTNEHGGDFFVEMGHTAPDPELDAATTAAVLETNTRVLRRLDFRDGIAHAEYRIGADGTPVLMEIAARAAGDSILMLYHLATGVPMETALLGIALGEPTTYPPVRRYARQVYLPHRPGILRDVTADGLGTPVTWLDERWMWPPVQPSPAGAPARIQMIMAGRPAGTALAEIRQSGDRSSMYVIDAATAGELDAIEARCTAAIEVHTDVRTEVAA
ncbi:hypothetical protein GCM10010435_83250 [Winogradskya consettensis]|uniref:ATP-grasp domain-containing protein n=1 Tax=Winogradskya consettensis TaxID=113560 RepID=A0A919T1I1_9ACTN|nr:ATP-grasp domain-containing protein [Actinoplanes consettensis]GIM82292.1 hypothetical protein Aco04nite_80850 [Actinoplanes consettensis]